MVLCFAYHNFSKQCLCSPHTRLLRSGEDNSTVTSSYRLVHSKSSQRKGAVKFLQELFERAVKVKRRIS